MQSSKDFLDSQQPGTPVAVCDPLKDLGRTEDSPVIPSSSTISVCNVHAEGNIFMRMLTLRSTALLRRRRYRLPLLLSQKAIIPCTVHLLQVLPVKVIFTYPILRHLIVQ